jgi:hypothetical protein
MLLPNFHALRSAYTSGELMDIIHVRSGHSLSDDFTKLDSEGANTQLRNAMNTGTLPESHIYRVIVDDTELATL